MEAATEDEKKMTSFFASSTFFFKDIKLAHSVFALPFAAVALLMIPLPENFLSSLPLLLACMITARSFAMGVNRYLDRDIDKLNPRTAQRLIPNGTLRPAHGLIWSLIMGLGFVVCARLLSPLAGILSVPLLVILASYSLMKNLTFLTHWYLGFCLGLAPIAVCVALNGFVPLVVLLIGVAVMMWTAGFDILYALQDREFDREKTLHSVPARFGVRPAIYISRASFACMIVSLLIGGYMASFGLPYFIGVALIAIFLAYEHWLVRDALRLGFSNNINQAFFTVNAWVGVLFFAIVQLDRLLAG